MRPFLIAALLCASLSAHAAGIGLGSFPAHGVPVASDLLPIQAAASTTTQKATVADVQSYVLTSVKAYGAVGDGINDDTTAIQTAINTGLPLYFPPGTYKTTASLNVTTYASNGGVIRGAGSTYNGGSSSVSPGATIIKPTSAVTKAVVIDGIGVACPGAPFCYIQGFDISNLAIDMASMSAGSTAFWQGQSFDIRYKAVRVLNDTAKTALRLSPGAFVTVADTFEGGTVSCVGNGVQNPTTLTVINPDILALNDEQCANVTVLGGAVQFSFNPGVTTMVYIPPGNTNLLGFYPTTQGLWAATGGTPAGMYVALGSYTLNAQNITSSGTDWEVINQVPTACSVAGSTWAYGSYNDGVHGCLPAVWALSIGANTHGCSYDNPVFGSLYLWQPVNPGCSVRGVFQGGATHNAYQGIVSDFSGTVNLFNAQAMHFYSDMAMTQQTAVIDAGSGDVEYTHGTVRPQADNTNFLNWYNAHGDQIGIWYSNANPALSVFKTLNGSYIEGDDSIGGVAYQFLGNGVFYFKGGGQINGTLTNNGAVYSYANVIHPAVNSAELIFLESVSGLAVLDCGTIIGFEGCGVANGAKITGYSDAFSTQTYVLNSASGSGVFTGSLSAASLVATTASSLQAATATTLNATSNVQIGGRVATSATAPTVASGFSTGTPSVGGAATNAFTVTIGSTPGGTGVLTMPTATTGWACTGIDRTTAAGTIRETATGATSATFALASTVNGDVLQFQCQGY